MISVKNRKIKNKLIETIKGMKYELKKRNISISIDYHKITSKLIKFIKDDSSGMLSSINFEFSNSDLVNGKLTKFHGLNNSKLDVTVLNHLGQEVEITSTVSINSVVLDLERVQIPVGVNWVLLLES